MNPCSFGHTRFSAAIVPSVYGLASTGIAFFRGTQRATALRLLLAIALQSAVRARPAIGSCGGAANTCNRGATDHLVSVHSKFKLLHLVAMRPDLMSSSSAVGLARSVEAVCVTNGSLAADVVVSRNGVYVCKAKHLPHTRA